MVDISMTRLHEITIVLYAISVLCYFVDFLHNNRKANRFAFWLLSIVWLLQTIFLFLYMMNAGRFPVLTIFEGLYFYVWVLVTLSLCVNALKKVDFIVFFTNILGFAVMVIHTFTPIQNGSQIVAQQLMSELLLIHIMMAFFAYGAFTISFVLSILYLIQYDLLKRKKWGKRLKRLGNLASLESLSYLLNVIALPVLCCALIIGVKWANIKLPEIDWFDSKIIGSFFIIMIYSIFIFVKLRKQVNGKNLAYFNIASFLIVLLNFFLFGSLSEFHYWNT